MTHFLHYQVQDTRHKEVIALKANMNSVIRLETAAIFSTEPLSETRYCQSVYVMFDFIWMGLLELPRGDAGGLSREYVLRIPSVS